MSKDKHGKGDRLGQIFTYVEAVRWNEGNVSGRDTVDEAEFDGGSTLTVDVFRCLGNTATNVTFEGMFAGAINGVAGDLDRGRTTTLVDDMDSMGGRGHYRGDEEDKGSLEDHLSEKKKV